jgi:hypothetical protein
MWMAVGMKTTLREVSIDVLDKEIEAYAKAVRGLPIAENRLGDRQLQENLRKAILSEFAGIGAIVSAVDALSNGREGNGAPDYYLIKGLRFHELAHDDDGDIRGSFVVGLSSFWGTPALGNYHAPDSKFAYRHVKARAILAGEQRTLLNSVREGFPHTDSAFKAAPEPLFALFMARAAEDGGDTLIWNVRDLTEWIASRPGGGATLEMLRTIKVPFVGSVLTADKVVEQTILMEGSDYHMRYKRDAIEDGAKALGRELTSDEKHMMDVLDKATDAPELTIRFGMGNGDAVVLDNHRALHSRSPFADVKRHVLKTTLYRN